MDLTYSIRAHDGQTYGPYNLEDIQDWIREGRINAVGENAGKRGLAIALDVLLIGFFVVCGIFAHKGHLWAFALGLAVYLLDTILCLVAQEWIGLAFHIWALFSIASAMRLAWLMRR
jgi:hypothetical protein